jgi:serine/threonine-protein kinase
VAHTQNSGPSSNGASLAPGVQLNGIYQIEKLLAMGGMGEVYKASVVHTGDPVAVKVIRPDLTENEDVIALFRKEASALHTLYHEAIVRYFVFSKDPILNRSYLAMEFVEGEPLSAILTREALQADTVLKLARRLACGLNAAHEQVIFHRDVSPDNIIIQNGDVECAKIIDFGIARSTKPDSHTIIGSGFAGKYNYVSPEQLGLFGADVRAQSDIYSLGLVLAEAAGHRIDMNGNQVEIIEKRRKVPDLSAFEPRLRFLLEKMLQPDPTLRPESMLAIADYVTHELGAPSNARASSTILQRPGTPARRREERAISWPIIAGIPLALALIAGAGGYVWWNAPPAAVKPPSADLHQSDTWLQGSAEKSEPSGQGTDASSSQPSESLQPDRQDFPEKTKETSADKKTDVAIGPPDTLRPPEPHEPIKPVDFVRSFPIGACSAITSLIGADRSTSIEGLGLTTDSFDRLDDAFKQSLGFEADITVRLVKAAQCPVLAFLRAVEPAQSLMPNLTLGATKLHGGQTLSGSVSASPDRKLQLLLVNDAGGTRKITNLVRTNGGSTFNVILEKPPGTGGGPQLIMAISSKRELPSLQAAPTPRVERLFPSLETEAKQPDEILGVAVGYVQVE